MLVSLMLSGFAMAQDAPIGACDITFEVVCMDCGADEGFKAEIYQFALDGTRMQVKYLPAMKSGESISSGYMTPGRRTLVIEDAEFATVVCVNDENVHYQVQAILHQEATEDPDDDFVYDPAPAAPAEPVNLPGYKPATAHPDPTPPDFEEEEEEEAGDTEVVDEPPSAPQLAPLPKPAPEPTPPARVMVEEEEDYGSVVSRVVGWAAPGGDPVWTGNAGDYPSSPVANRRGKFADSGESQCLAGKLPAVLGTADHISGGRPAQDALDDARARDVAPAGWNGAYAIALRTAILGDQAAAVWCINPGDLNPTSPEGREMVAAAMPQPAQPPGVTPEALQQALADQAKKLREELKPPEEGPKPPETTAKPTPTPFVLRKGGFVAFQYSTAFEEGVAYPHGLVGGFVTFNLTPKTGRLGLEPYIGVGTDAESTHPCGVAEDGSLSMCSGWYLSTTAGVRLPWAVMKKDTFQLLVFPDLGLVSDDITVGFTSWGDLVSFQAGVELWLTGKVPFAVSLETGATRLSLMNDSQQHTNGWAWPIRLDVKVAFK